MCPTCRCGSGKCRCLDFFFIMAEGSWWAACAGCLCAVASVSAAIYQPSRVLPTGLCGASASTSTQNMTQYPRRAQRQPAAAKVSTVLGIAIATTPGQSTRRWGSSTCMEFQRPVCHLCHVLDGTMCLSHLCHLPAAPGGEAGAVTGVYAGAASGGTTACGPGCGRHCCWP